MSLPFVSVPADRCSLIFSHAGNLIDAQAKDDHIPLALASEFRFHRCKLRKPITQWAQGCRAALRFIDFFVVAKGDSALPVKVILDVAHLEAGPWIDSQGANL